MQCSSMSASLKEPRRSAQQGPTARLAQHRLRERSHLPPLQLIFRSDLHAKRSVGDSRPEFSRSTINAVYRKTCSEGARTQIFVRSSNSLYDFLPLLARSAEDHTERPGVDELNLCVPSTASLELASEHTKKGQSSASEGAMLYATLSYRQQNSSVMRMASSSSSLTVTL